MFVTLSVGERISMTTLVEMIRQNTFTTWLQHLLCCSSNYHCV